jgi:predicted ATPase
MTMLNGLQIKNFKAWGDTGKLRLAPITVFFGANSSGKSSIGQFLLMLRQTAESPDRHRILHPGDGRTTPIDLGTYKDLVHGHDEAKHLEFSLSWGLDHELKVKDVKNDCVFAGDRIVFEADIGVVKEGGSPLLHSMRYGLAGAEGESLAIGMKAKDPQGKEYELVTEKFLPVRTQGRPTQIPRPIRFYGFPDEVPAYHQNVDFSKDLNLQLEQRLKSIFYLGPLRAKPTRTYVWSGEVPESVGWTGERVIDSILSARGREISKLKNQKLKPFEEVIARWLKSMDLIQSFRVSPISENRREYEVLVKTKGSASEVNLTDVGFGVSQVLPVLVECFYAPAGSIVVMEQPEIHLHPAVQAHLADLFIEVIRSWEEGRARDTQLIIESHSEHFLRRLQRRIAEGKVSREEVAIYVCGMDKGQGHIEPLDIDIFGEIRNWPTDFFGDPMEDLSAMMDARADRMGGP